MPEVDNPSSVAPDKEWIIASFDGSMSEEEFDDLEDCPRCISTLMLGSQHDFRVDEDRSMNDSQHQDPANAGVKISADMDIKICTGCQWAVVKVAPTSYAGY